MPQTKTITSTKKKAKQLRKGGKHQHGKQQQQHSAKELFQAAEQAASTNEWDQAVALYTAALNVPVDQCDMDVAFVLEKRAEAQVSASDPEGALHDYQQALQLVQEQSQPGGQTMNQDPATLERLASLHLYMGQLQSEHDALACYQQGMQHLEQSLELRSSAASDNNDDDDNEAAISETRQQLAAACCSAAELYLTDLCSLDEAEGHCQDLVERALRLSPNSPDALQTAASLRLSQCRSAEAVVYMQQCFAPMKVACDALSRLVGLLPPTCEEEGALELTHVEAVQALPGFEFRCQTAKLLLECASLEEEATTKQQECAEAAVTVLGSLLAENDEVLEVWSLAGDAFCRLADAPAATFYYQRAVELLQAMQREMQDEEDAAGNDMTEEEEEARQEQLDELACQLQELQQKMRQLPALNDDNDEAMADTNDQES